VSTWDDADLAELRFHWDTAYEIYHPEPDVWVAVRRDNRETLRADTPDALRDKIVSDYFAHPVSRRLLGEHRGRAPARSRFTCEG
jgi:hypothetical protein